MSTEGEPRMGRGGWTGLLLLVGLVLVAGVAIMASDKVTTYFERGDTSAQLTTLSHRTELWSVAFESIEKKPLFGNGITASRGIFYEATGLGGGHNGAINVLVELGAVGLLVWAALLISLLLGIRHLPRNGPRDLQLDRAMLLGVMTFLLVDSIFYEGIGSVANVASTWLFMCIGWYVVARRDGRRPIAAAEVESVPVPAGG